MNKVLTFDIEADNLLMKASKVWCIAIMENDIVTNYTDLTEALKELSTADVLIGHNIIMYDLPVLRRVLGWEPSNQVKIVDTLLMSRVLFPDRPMGHSLAAWGERLGLPKTEYKDFTKYTAEMGEYCKNDVKVTHRVYNSLMAELKGYDHNLVRCIKLEHDFAKIILKQIEAGFTLDVPRTMLLYDELKDEATEITNTLMQILPSIKDNTHYKGVVKEGRLLSETSTEYTYIQPKTKKVATKAFKFTEPNPTSRQQIAAFLQSKGWKPKEYTETGQPKVDEKVLSAVDIREAKMISRLFRLQKQYGMIKNESGGWLNYVNPITGRIHGDVITNGANTGRCTHSQPNMAQVDKKDKRMREVWTAQKGWKLVGCDAASLELRILAHYLAPYDKGLFAFEVVSGDVHARNKEVMGLELRDSAKTAIYALVYGAGVMKLGKTVSVDRGRVNASDRELASMGKALKENILENFTGYKQLMEGVKKAFEARGYLIGLDGRPLHVREDYAALNLLIQSAGAVIMKQALVNLEEMLTPCKDYYNFVANVHDEIQIECAPEIAEMVSIMAVKAIEKTTEDFNLKCDMTGEAKIGNNWAETH